MNADFLKGVVPMSLVRLDSMFGDGAAMGQFSDWNRKYAKLIMMLNERQSAEITRVMEGNRCTGVKMAWMKNCTPMRPMGCDPNPTSCDITATPNITVDDKLYNPSCRRLETFSLNDDLCNNLFTAEEAIAKGLAHAVKRLDIFLNRKAYTVVEANATANTADLPIGTVNGLVTEVHSALWTADLIVQMGAEAEVNGLNNWVAFDGRNLVVTKKLAEFHKMNANETHGAVIFRDAGNDLVFDDPTDSNFVTGRNSTFLIDMDAFAFVNRTVEYNEMTEVDEKLNIWAWNVISPLTGVRYLVEYKKECTGQDADGTRHTNHIFNVSFYGDIIAAPTKCVGVGHALEYARVA